MTETSIAAKSGGRFGFLILVISICFGLRYSGFEFKRLFPRQLCLSLSYLSIVVVLSIDEK
jgi:hypothetical protein